MAGPLEGVKIVDMTNVVMGPFATRLLGDMGADVVKIEPLTGDSTRRLGPSRHAGMGSYFMNLNRSKKSLALDLKQAKGMEILRKLITRADVLISNIRPKALKRLGLSYQEVSADHGRLIYASLVGYGQDGPYAARPAYDDLMQGATGIAALMAESGDGVPRYAPFNVADRTVGMSAVNAVLAALYSREKTGRGQAIEIPMFETITDFLLVEHLGGLAYVPDAGPWGYSRTLSRERKPYQTLDGHISVQVYNDKHWKSFFEMTGLTEKYGDDARFADLGARTEHVFEINTILAQALAQRGTDEWLKLLNDADIPATPVHTIASLVNDVHHAATGFFEVKEHPSEGPIRSMKIPSTWSATKPQVRNEAPRLGEHSVEILRDLGYSASEIDAMIADQVTRLAKPEAQ